MLKMAWAMRVRADKRVFTGADMEVYKNWLESTNKGWQLSFELTGEFRMSDFHKSWQIKNKNPTLSLPTSIKYSIYILQGIFHRAGQLTAASSQTELYFARGRQKIDPTRLRGIFPETWVRSMNSNFSSSRLEDGKGRILTSDLLSF